MPRLCIVTDIHHGPDTFTKKGAAAPRLMEGFAGFCRAEAPDAVIDLGDRISDSDPETDRRLAREAAAMFAPIAAPRLHVCGNHDRVHLSVEENEEILGQSLGHQTVDIDGWTLVLWRAETRIARGLGLVLRECDLTWLAGVVARAEGPLAVFSHVPVSGHGQAGNYYFQHNPDASTYPNAADRVRAVLATARVPLVWVAGHVHWNTLTVVNGQPHLTLQSLTETFTTHPEPAGSYAVLDLGADIAWTVHGRDGLHVRLRAADSVARWVAPLPRFEDHPEIRLWRQAAGR
ncbi:MAG: metallophosphoesterase [Rhodospirillaceae bacterium]|nr:metallophosphoesterase [Rhodospirillaceae bacterium]